MSDKKISKTVIRRLPKYYSFLGELMMDGVERISSSELSEKMQVTASQIRQDLNNFGGFGQQGYGYNVKYLHREIGSILGLNKKKNLIIIGAGNLGRAIANYTGFIEYGFNTLALFDCDENKINPKGNMPVYSIDSLAIFLEENTVHIAAIAVPKQFAVETAKFVVGCGIKGIWNFAPINLKPIFPEGVAIKNVHLVESLMELSYEYEHLN